MDDKEQVVLYNFNGMDEKIGYLYAILCEDAQAVKFGITTGTVQKRIEELQTGNPFTLLPVACHITESVFTTEKYLHTFFKPYNVRGEWYQWNLPIQMFVWQFFGKIFNPMTFDIRILKNVVHKEEFISLYGEIVEQFGSSYKDLLPQYTPRIIPMDIFEEVDTIIKTAY